MLLLLHTTGDRIRMLYLHYMHVSCVLVIHVYMYCMHGVY